MKSQTTSAPHGGEGSTHEPGTHRPRGPKARTEPDPWSILGVSPEADDEQIRAAYMRKVKEYPPDRSGPEFERVRDAYEQLKDPYRRARHLILGASPDMPLESLLDEVPGPRNYVGPEPWLAVMQSQRKEPPK